MIRNTELPVTSAKNFQAITAGPDGNLWFTESGVSKIGQMTAGK
jgi:streptogramin lyase